MSSKRIALKDYVEVDGVDLSLYCRSVAFSSVDERVDASGFNSTGADEFLAGRTREITCEFMNSRAANLVHQVIYRLHDEKVEFDFEWRADSTAGASSTNPALRGTVILPEYQEGAVRGELEVLSLTFVSQGDAGLEFSYT